MKATELRIGNYIKQPNGVNTVFHISEGEDVNTFPEEKIESIPITEDWLERFGFINSGLSGNMFIHKNMISAVGDRFIIEADGVLFYPQINHDLCSFAEFKYVHQLQNLYFALTGNELTIQP